jgi:hypothetical protein
LRIVVLLAALSIAASARAEELVGRASIVNAGLLTIDSTDIRLMGVDAPDLEQIC